MLGIPIDIELGGIAVKIQNYDALYKCRLCGNTYSHGCVRTDQVQIFMLLGDMINGTHLSSIENNLLGNVEVHCCSDHTTGVSDFVGFVLNEKR